jgi:mannose-6-phosphate isomerase-like protein (cupin superfamily)
MTYPKALYKRDDGEVSALYRPADREPDLTVGENIEVRYLATGDSTDGLFGLYRWDAKPHAGGAAPHFHKTFSESFFVLSGTVRVYDGEHWIDADAGDFIYVPPGGIHGFSVDSDEPASMLLLFTPGAPREPYFEGLSRLAAGRQFSEEEWSAFVLEHDNHFI